MILSYPYIANFEIFAVLYILDFGTSDVRGHLILQVSRLAFYAQHYILRHLDIYFCDSKEPHKTC